MKFLSISILAAALLGLTSCSKQTDTKVSDSQINNNNNSNGNAGFNWEGTAPLSAKVNGVPFLATSADVIEFFGYYNIFGKAGDGRSINPSIPVGAVPGLVYSMPSPANISWSDQNVPLALGASPGKVKIVTNNATTLEGYFWADTKDPAGQNDTVVYITEGYFKVDKP